MKTYNPHGLVTNTDKKPGSGFKDIGMFLKEWFADPLQVASVIPSSQSLASLITKEITPGPLKVVEFGPGTGVFTRALIRRGIPEEQLILVEAGESFATLLKQRYPKATVLQQDAASFWKYHRRENQKIGAIISGLPLLSMTTRKVAGVLKNISSNLVPGGAFYQFTYGLKVPVSKRVLQKMGLAYSRLGGTLGNFPPASVYRIYNEKYHVSESINYRHNGLITVTV